MPFQPGISGNPKGRPKKERELTGLIKRALSKTVNDPNTGKRISRKRLMANLLVMAVTEGKITFPGGPVIMLGANDWINFVMRLLQHIDGPAVSQHDLNVSGMNLLWEPHTPEPSHTEQPPTC